MILPFKNIPFLSFATCVLVAVLLFFTPFDPVNITKRFLDAAQFLGKISSPLSLGVCLCKADRDVEFERDDGLKIAGSLYGIEGPNKKPGILLLHGNTPLGRKLPFYPILATKLAERGYIVLTIDRTGFGESDDPFLLDDEEALSGGGDKDVRAALNYLRNSANVIRDEMNLIGHSGGASSAFSVGIEDPDVKRIIVIGPPRRVTERMADPQDVEYFWQRAQQTRQQIHSGMFPSWYTKELWLKGVLDNDMKKHISYFSQKGHKPVLLIDGELELAADKEYLENYHRRIVEPKRYVTLASADHYCNTTRFKALNYYDKDVIERLVTEIVGRRSN